MGRKFSILETLKVAWKSLFSQVWVLVGLLIGFVIISLAINLYNFDTIGNTFSIGGVAISIVSLLFSMIFTLGYTKNLFQVLDKEEPQFSAYGRECRKLLSFFLAHILFLVIICIGLILFVFPGIYLAIRLQFYYTAIVDENLNSISSLKRSWEITKGQFCSLFILMLVAIFLIFFGIIFFGIGVFLTYPLVSLMNVYVFRKLTAFAS